MTNLFQFLLPPLYLFISRVRVHAQPTTHQARPYIYKISFYFKDASPSINLRFFEPDSLMTGIFTLLVHVAQLRVNCRYTIPHGYFQLWYLNYLS